jgi:hypothetical protein
MLTPNQIADVAVARLGLPVAMAKLQIMHDIAANLRDEESGPIVWDALLRWIKSRELESEVLEGLCPLILAKGARVLKISTLRLNIERPSILSDVLIAEAFGSPLLVTAWMHSHSEEVPHLMRLNQELEELSSARFVPPLFGNRLRALEQRSSKPFLRQWAYEFTLLRSRGVYTDGGDFGYFRGDTTNGTGMFTGKRSHLARSAFLRTLALAVSRWGMPQDLAEEVAQFALPAEPILLKLLPGSPPSWASAAHAWPIDDANADLPTEIAQLVGHIEHHTGRTLLHFKGCIHSSKTMRAEVEVTTVLAARGAADPEEVFKFQNALLGKVKIPRHNSESFNSCYWPQENTLPGKDGVEYLPALLPLIGNIVGYLSTDLLHLLPQIPAIHSTEGTITAIPEVGGVSILWGGSCGGRVDYWNWHWQPMHEMNSMPPSAVCTTLAADIVEKLFLIPGYTVNRCWKILLRTRDTDYGSWSDTVRLGVLA